MTDDTRPDARALVVLGASGDLTERLLLPGLATLLQSDRGRPVRVIGTGRSEMADDDWRELVAGALRDDDRSGALLDDAVEQTRYLQGDPTEAEHLRDLLDAAAPLPAVLYFALPPGVVADICEALAELDLPDDLVLAFDKPFGTDEASARRLTELAHRLVPEERVHRTDHFLGNPVVRGLLGARAGSPLLERSLDARGVAAIEIVYDEELALEGRAGYYDSSGALVDMLQSHLLETLAVLTCELPDDLGAAAVQQARTALLRSVSVADPVTEHSARARYTAGSVAGRQVPAYADEEGVDADAGTETLARLELEIDSDRWRGVPVVLRSGKALGEPRRELRVTFRAGSADGDGPAGLAPPAGQPASALTVDLKSGAWRLTLPTTTGDDPRRATAAELTGTPPIGRLDAYGSVIAGVLDGDQLLSVGSDAVEQCWRIVDPVLAAWRDDRVPLQEYPAGSDGPQDW